jgi:hypothetical protein
VRAQEEGLRARGFEPNRSSPGSLDGSDFLKSYDRIHSFKSLSTKLTSQLDKPMSCQIAPIYIVNHVAFFGYIGDLLRSYFSPSLLSSNAVLHAAIEHISCAVCQRAVSVSRSASLFAWRALILCRCQWKLEATDNVKFPYR